ncbi:squalene synthase HpnC [Streptomyces sp. PLAI1-29]|uniref:Squalene synthase HpnC n=2 Tax=Streptomyces zingiberis TaxID=2053010 RepID=A0ABX1C5Q4_9ACTN|nr:squalene synthase HpnC [Streptomyces zingiberis]
MAVYGYARLVDDIGDGDLDPAGGDAAVLLGEGPCDLAGGPEADGPRRPAADPVADRRPDGERRREPVAHPDPSGRVTRPVAGAAEPAVPAVDRLALLDAAERDLHRVFAPGGEPRHPLLRALRPLVRRQGLTPEPFLALIEAGRRDQRVTRYRSWEDLLGYCELSANPVGRLVLAVTGTTSAERVRRSDAVCTGLQVVEHLQDVAEDLTRGRIYLPADAMARHGVREEDLRRPEGSPSVRALVREEALRAHALLDEGGPLVRGVTGRLRLLLAGFVGGGRAALGAIAAAGYDVLPEPPRPSRTALLRAVAVTLRREG